MKFPFEWLGRYLQPSDYDEAARWSENLRTEELIEASYAEWKIAEWVRSSVHKQFRLVEIDFSRSDVEEVFRRYLYSGLLAGFGLDRLLKEYQPDTMLLYNGRADSTRVALELALRAGVRVVTYERGYRHQTMIFTENESCGSTKPRDLLWHHWGDIPLAKHELDQVHQYLSDREKGKNTNWFSYATEKQDDRDLGCALRLSPDRPLWVVFLSSEDEVADAPQWKGDFEGQNEWIERTLAYAALHPEIDFVVRAHPNTAGRFAHGGDNEVQLNYLISLKNQLPENVRLVMPDNPVSSYTLMEMATLGLVYHSTVGLEMCCKGKAVVVAAGSWITGLPFATGVDCAPSYHSVLDRFVALPVGYRDPEVQRLAYRLAYGLYFRRVFDFPLVRMPDGPNRAELAYSRLEELRPGAEANLDRVCRVLLQAESVCPIPGSSEISRSTFDEDLWLNRFYGGNYSVRPMSKAGALPPTNLEGAGDGHSLITTVAPAQAPALEGELLTLDEFDRRFSELATSMQWHEAEAITVAALRQHPDESALWVYLALSLRMQGFLKEALEAAERSLITGGVESPAALFELLQIAVAQGSMDDALKIAEHLRTNHEAWESLIAQALHISHNE